MTPEQAKEHQIFIRHLETLHGDDLLDAQLDFDELPPAKEGERDLRLLGGLSLEAAMLSEFGFGAHKLLAARKEQRSKR